MITVTGATGALNGATVEHLLNIVPPSEITVVARDATAASRFAERGVEVRAGDYADPTSLLAAFEGADQLLLVSSSNPAGDGVQLHRNAITAAIEVGVGRILYTSHQGAALDNPFGPAREHAETERILAESGLPWTSLRNGSYAHTLDYFLGPWRETGVIEVAIDGPVSWTAREESAEAAALVILSNGSYDGPITLTARAAPTFADIADIASELSGKPVELRVIGEDAWVQARVASGQPEFVARFMLGFYTAAAAGFYAGTDPLLEQMLGRAPRTVRAVLLGAP